MNSCNAYESECMSDILGQTLRPGGFALTQQALKFCKITDQDKVLDLGCGMGATIQYLYENYHIKAVGIDPSEKLLNVARERCDFAELVLGSGDFLPFEKQSFHLVFSECSLSLMDDIQTTLTQVHCILKENGWFVITDVYARRPQAIQELESYPINSCIRGLHDIERLQEELKNAGFEIAIFEDCSDLLKELLVKIIFSHGSMDVFWEKTVGSKNCELGSDFQQKLKLCKPGYFILIARKGE